MASIPGAVFTLDVEQQDRVIVRVNGDLDLATQAMFDRHLAGAVERTGDLVVDLEACGFTGVAAVRSIDAAASILHSRGCALTVRLPPLSIHVIESVLSSHGEHLAWLVVPGEVAGASAGASQPLDGPRSL